MLVRILVVEDNQADAILLREAFAGTKFSNDIKHVKSGEDALAYLHRCREVAPDRMPDIVMLDLNLPGMSGLELLAKIKEDAALCHIPVVILTTSKAHADISRAYANHANCYIVKPVGFEQLAEVARCIDMFWLGTATLP